MKKKGYIFTKHANKRMRKKKIDMTAVEQVCRTGKTVTYCRDGQYPTIVREKQIQGKRLRVVLHGKLVITTYWVDRKPPENEFKIVL